jgi:hypothetical protein
MEQTRRLTRVPIALIRREFQKARSTDTVSDKCFIFSRRYEPKKIFPFIISILLFVAEIIIHKNGIPENTQTIIKNKYINI